MTVRQNKYGAQACAALKRSGRSAAVLMTVGLTLSMASIAQDSVSMVDAGAIAKVSTVATSINTAAINNGAVGAVAEQAVVDSQVSATAESTKSPITGLEPGTLALIGFGLIALAATRRNAR